MATIDTRSAEEIKAELEQCQPVDEEQQEVEILEEVEE